jgi:hypothetical protein
MNNFKKERKKSHHKKVLVEWLKVKVLSSNSSTGKKKKQANKEQKQNIGWALVAYECNPSYWGCRDQKDLVLRPVLAKSLRDPIPQKYPT